MRKVKLIFLFVFAFFLVNLSQVSAADEVVALEGASIRIKTETSAQGLRFYAQLDESVKDNEHGFYLVYGKTTVIELEDAIVEAGSGKVILNGKEVYHISIPGVTEENRFSVVLTGIPNIGYFDEISVIAYVVVGSNKLFVKAPVTRSVAEVAINMSNAGMDTSGIESFETITETAKKKVAVNAFGNVQVSSGLYELNHFSLAEEFLKDWNSRFSVSLVDLEAAEFFASAKEGTEDADVANKDLSKLNIYKFFNDQFYGVKWGWLLDLLNTKDTHPTRQIAAVKGAGTNEDYLLYNGSHLSHSLTNFFNQEHEVGGYSAIDFKTRLNYYDEVKTYNNKVFIDMKDYELYDVGASYVVPGAPAAKEGYNFANYKVGETNYSPGSLYVIGADVVFEAVYTPITYSVKFFDGAVELMDLEATYNIEGELVLPKPEKEGLTFRGWHDNEGLTGDAISKINIGEMGNKTFYAKWIEGDIVTYYLGDYGYHTSTKTKPELFEEFVTDFRTLFGRTGSTVEQIMASFYTTTFLPSQFNILDIFTYENGKYAWLKEHLIAVAVEDDYIGTADLLNVAEDKQAAWRTQIEAFFTETEIKTTYEHLSLDFELERNAHNFWQYTDYGTYLADFVAGGALFNEVKTDSKIYSFAGFEDKDGQLVTVLPAEANGLELFARWERSAFYVDFYIGYSAVSPATQLVLKNAKVVEPSTPTRVGYTFGGWYKNLSDEQAYDFDSPVTAEFTLSAKWDEVMAEEYDITYNLDGGKIVYGTKDELINGFLEDFYAYLNLSSSLDEFKHGVGKSTGYDGTWHSIHQAKIYAGARPTAVNEAFFASSSEYMDKWLPFFDTIHEFVVVVNNTQFFWGASTSTGLIRIKQYVTHVKPAAYVADETMNMIPDEGIEMPAVVIGKVGIPLTLQKAYKEGKTFGGWYLTSDFSGTAVTTINQSTDDPVILYAKFT